MQKRKLIAIGVAVALQTYCCPVMAAEINDDDEKRCPTNISQLSKAEREKLSAECLAVLSDQNDHWGWVAGGVAALAAGVAIGIDNNGGGSVHHNAASDDDGNITPIPPDDGGSNTPVPSDDGGDTPDDSGDDIPPDTSVTTFSNGITLDRGADTLHFDDIKLENGDHLGEATLNYSEQDQQWLLTTPNGFSLQVDDWNVTDANAAVIEGTQANGLYWKYDSRGYLILADDQTPVLAGNDAMHITDRGLVIGGKGYIGMIISGDRTVNTLSGDSTVTDNATGIVITGDETTNTISGQSVVDGATGALISGDGSTTSISGGINVSEGGTGVIIDGDHTTTDNTGTSNISGAGSTGSIINGDGAYVINDGELNTSDGAIGAIIIGDDAIVDNIGDSSASGAGSIGLDIDGDNATITNEGHQKISDGATGIQVNGDSTVFNNTGASDISGAGSNGIIVNGDETRITNDGELSVADGGTGAEITGDHAIIDNTGDSTISGNDSTGLIINGEHALVISEGDQNISGGATGTYINGGNARMANTGDMTIDGAGSAGTIINGDDASLTQAGGLLVTGGATGIITYGKNNTAKNTGNMVVRDEGSNGFIIAGEQNTFNNKGNIDVSLNGTGTLVSGDMSQIVLDGDINVHSAKDSNGVWQGATGINVSGDNTTTAITGNVYINADFTQTDDVLSPDDQLTGITIGGNNNNIALDGTLNISLNDKSVQDNDTWTTFSTVGLEVGGNGNNVHIAGGINIDSNQSGIRNDDTYSYAIGINIDGVSTVTLSGQSYINMATNMGYGVTLAKVLNGGTLILDENAEIDVNSVDVPFLYYDAYNALLQAEGQNTSIENKGIINITGTSPLMNASHGGQVKNSGEIHAWLNKPSDESEDITIARAAIMNAINAGSAAENTTGGTITLISELTPIANGYKLDDYPLQWVEHTYYGLLASRGGSVVNNEGATISLYGAGLYGVSASKGTARNDGSIFLDGFQQQLDDKGNIISESYWSPEDLFQTSSAMVAGTMSTNSGDATATNTGTITVNNAGFGMMALNGGTAVNQGEITLTADEGITKTDVNQLVGMVALKGGTVINDTTGTININADYGKPFYADDSSLVINYGIICIADNCQNSDQYNPTDDYVSLPYFDGLIADTNETVTLTNDTAILGEVGNNGTVNGNQLQVLAEGTLTNNTSGIINNAIIIDGGTLENNGLVNSVTLNTGNFNNSGTTNAQVTVGGGTFTNAGTVDAQVIVKNNGIFNNLAGGEVNRSAKISNNAVVTNNGTWHLGYQEEGKDKSTLDLNNKSVFINSGEFILDNSQNAINLRQGGRFYNTGHMALTASAYNGAINIWNNTPAFINAGVVDATTKTLIASGGNADNKGAFFWNQEGGVINYALDNGTAVKFTHNNYMAQNDGVMNISGNNAYGMYGSKNAQLVNNGTINLGTEGTADTGMTAMALDANAATDAVIENNGTINIYADNSYAFSVAGAGHIVNNGTVVIADGVEGSGLIKQGDSVNVEGMNGNNGNNSEAHYASYTLPDVPESTVTVNNASSDVSSTGNDLTGYVVGTNANGSAGQLMVNNASMSGVGINTGFTAGTADTTVTFDNVVEGNNLTDAAAITSTSVVWNAQGSHDSDGNVDVTMTKNAYVEVVTDVSVSDVAQALDTGYTNNELYTSLNVGTTAELNSALKQVSGSQANTVFREARVLSNRFSMLVDAAPQIKDGLAFNVVAKGDPRAELGNDTQYDMLALRQTLDLSANQNLTLEYGIARLDGNGAQSAGDNGVTGGYSQFFGLKHSMAFDDGLAWNNALRYDVHNLDSNRSVSYGDVSKVADSDVRQQYLEFRSEGAKTVSMMNDALKVTPYAGVKFRHTLEGGYQERSAGDFNLSMNAGSETAVDSIVGMKFDYIGENGWSASATLEGGPNLSYSKSQRTASLQGAAGQSFSVDDDQRGGGVNGLATVGVKYSAKDASLNLDAYQWKEDGISDKGFMLNFRKTFR